MPYDFKDTGHRRCYGRGSGDDIERPWNHYSGELHIKALFISRLSGVSLRNLGYNILTLLMREEQEALQRARVYLR